MTIYAWGVPMHTVAEVKKAFKKFSPTVFPDTSGSAVIVVGADTVVYGVGEKLLGNNKMVLVVDAPTVLRGGGFEFNGAVPLLYGRLVRTPLKAKVPKTPWKLPKLNAGEVLMTNAKRIKNLVDTDKGLPLTVQDKPFNEVIGEVRKRISAASKAPKKSKKKVDEE